MKKLESNSIVPGLPPNKRIADANYNSNCISRTFSFAQDRYFGLERSGNESPQHKNSAPILRTKSSDAVDSYHSIPVFWIDIIRSVESDTIL